MSRHARFAGLWCVNWQAEHGSIGGASVRLVPREPADASVPESTRFAAGAAAGAAAVLHRAGVCHLLRPGRRAGRAVRRRTVVGMLLGGALQHLWPHDRAHYFFARARWELDQLGLAIAQLAVLVLPPGADLQVAVDDSVFRRSGRKVHGAGWQHDGSSPSVNKLSYGNCFVTAGIVVSCRSAPAGVPAVLPGCTCRVRRRRGPARWIRPPPWSACSPWRSRTG